MDRLLCLSVWVQLTCLVSNVTARYTSWSVSSQDAAAAGGNKERHVSRCIHPLDMSCETSVAMNHHTSACKYDRISRLYVHTYPLFCVSASCHQTMFWKTALDGIAAYPNRPSIPHLPPSQLVAGRQLQLVNYNIGSLLPNHQRRAVQIRRHLVRRDAHIRNLEPRHSVHVQLWINCVTSTS